MAASISADSGLSSGTSGIKITSDNTGVLALQSGNNTTAITVNTSQNVGIGTSSPSQKLQVLATNSTGFAGAAIQNQNTNLGIAGVQFSSDTTYFKSAIGQVRSDVNGVGSLVFYNASSTGAANWDTSDERMRIDSSGNVGIGTTSPTTATDIVRSNTSGNDNQMPNLFVRNTSATQGNGSSTFNQAGVSVSAGNSTVSGGIRAAYDSAGSYGTGVQFYVNSTNPLQFYSNGSERMRIDSGGSLLVGTTTTSVSTTPGIVIIGSSGAQGYLLNNNTTGGGTSLALFYSSYSTANQTKFEVDSAGNVKSRTNSYAGFSDERLKQNITPASSQWNDIKSYDVVKFQMKSEQFSDEENPWMLGVVAQQVEQISPGLVDVDQKDGMKTVKYSILYMKAVKALQEAMAKIETLEAKADQQAETINALTARIVALEGK